MFDNTLFNSFYVVRDPVPAKGVKQKLAIEYRSNLVHVEPTMVAGTFD